MEAASTKNMPQFELKDLGPKKINAIVRARTPEQAVRQVLNLDENLQVVIKENSEDFARFRGWSTVYLNENALGHIRLFHRMKFRRD